MPDRTWVEIDLAAIRENARTVLARAKGARLLPMLKANAYGLGAVPVARALEELDPWGYGVATAEEGRELRASGITRAILVVQPQATMLQHCADLGLTPALGTIEDVRRWLALTKLPFHVGVDTGMNRGGIWWEDLAREAGAFADAPGLEGLMTHFHSADKDPASVREQWDRFQRALGALGRRPKLLHAANSAAALGHPGVAADLVRPGIFLYGGAAGTHRPKPVVTWRARIARVARREKGASVGYGATWRADAPVWITTLAAGYADGYRRALSNIGEALIDGRRCKVTGTVTMDFTMVRSEAATRAEQVATLVGTDGRETITLDEVAGQAGTISYEILTGLGPRVERVYR
ncbi:MAG: alanine racemase [Gemmatimonadales bacterium]